MLLNYVGPVSLLLHPESPQGSQSGAAAVADGLRATSSFVYWYASGIFRPQPPGINVGLSETREQAKLFPVLHFVESPHPPNQGLQGHLDVSTCTGHQMVHS